jgi:hypothetical protein
MQCAFLILTAIVISTATTDKNNFIPNRHQQIALCIQTVVQQYFTVGRTVLVSMPGDEQPTGRSLSPPPYDNNRALVSFTLTKLHENVSWPLRLISNRDIIGCRSWDKKNSYIIFIWPQHEDTEVKETLRYQVVTLKEAEGGSWNPWGKFHVVVADSDGFPPRELGLQIYVEMWKEHCIIENTILIAVRDNNVQINGKTTWPHINERTIKLFI